MSIKGNIILDDRYDKILSGSNINVRVELENMVPINLKEIYIMLQGKAQVKWEDLMNKNKDGIIVYFMQRFEGEEICVNQQTTIERNCILPAGSHVYNVVINIPHKLPETFKGKSGWINYELVLWIHVINTIQKLYTLPIIIERCSDFIPSELMLPLKATHNKFFCWRLCNSKPITTQLTLSSASYKPGDIVKYNLQIENFTKYFDVNRISVLIIQTQQYKATQPKESVKKEHSTLYYKSHCLTQQQRAKRCIDGTIQLSKTLTPTSLESCLIMHSYKFQVLIVMNGLHTDGYISLPLIVRHPNVKENVPNEIRLQMGEEPPPQYETLDLLKKNYNKTKILIETIV